VRDVDKFNKILNNVHFEDWRLYANLACFDRLDDKEVSGKIVPEGEKKW